MCPILKNLAVTWIYKTISNMEEELTKNVIEQLGYKIELRIRIII